MGYICTINSCDMVKRKLECGVVINTKQPPKFRKHWALAWKEILLKWLAYLDHEWCSRVLDPPFYDSSRTYNSCPLGFTVHVRNGLITENDHHHSKVVSSSLKLQNETAAFNNEFVVVVKLCQFFEGCNLESHSGFEFIMILTDKKERLTAQSIM